MSDSPIPIDLQIRKLRAETEKAEAERDNTLEELRQSRQIFTRLSKFFTPFVAILTIVFGYFAATYNSQVAQAKLEKAQAELEKQSTVAEKESAQRELTAAKETLASTNKEIGLINAARTRAEIAMAITQKQLASIQALQKQQSDRMALGDLQKLIDLLDSEPPEQKIASSRYIEDIRKEVAGDASNKNVRLVYLVGAAQNYGHHADLRALLYLSLFRITDDNQWLDAIRRLASERLSEAWLTFNSLLMLPNFDIKDRATVICSAYNLEKKKPIASRINADPDTKRGVLLYEMRMNLFRMDFNALLQCRAPYLDQFQFIRSQWEHNPGFLRKSMLHDALKGAPVDGFDPFFKLSSAAQKITKSPWQPMLLWYLNESSDNDLSEFALDLELLGTPPDLISAAKSGQGKTWADQHQKLLSLWNPGKLSGLNDSAFAKVMSGQWINDNEF